MNFSVGFHLHGIKPGDAHKERVPLHYFITKMPDTIQMFQELCGKKWREIALSIFQR